MTGSNIFLEKSVTIADHEAPPGHISLPEKLQKCKNPCFLPRWDSAFSSVFHDPELPFLEQTRFSLHLLIVPASPLSGFWDQHSIQYICQKFPQKTMAATYNPIRRGTSLPVPGLLQPPVPVPIGKYLLHKNGTSEILTDRCKFVGSWLEAAHMNTMVKMMLPVFPAPLQKGM